jgi:hypothetical protein
LILFNISRNNFLNLFFALSGQWICQMKLSVRHLLKAFGGEKAGGYLSQLVAIQLALSSFIEQHIFLLAIEI